MKKSIISLTLLAMIPYWTWAQNDKDTYNESVIVVGSFNPILEESFKVNVPTAITDTATTLQHQFTYDIATKRLTSLYNPTRIKAARIIGEPVTRLYNSYLRLGMGNYWSPLAEFYYNSTRNKKLTYGAQLSHQSSWGRIGPKVDTSALYSPIIYGKNHYSQTDVALFGKYIIKEKLQLSTDLSYNHDYNLLYGFSDSVLHIYDSLHPAKNYLRDSLHTKDYRMAYNYLNWNFGAKRLETDVNKLGYDANLSLANLWGSYGQGELNMNLYAAAHYGFSIANKYKGIAFLRLGWEGYQNTLTPDTIMPLGYIQSPITDSINVCNITTINPYVEFIFRNFNIHAGILVGVNNFDNPDSITTHIYPDVTISKSFLKEHLNISLGAVGGLQANSLNRMRMVNPYLAPGSGLGSLATSHYDFYARMRYNVNKKMQLKLHAEHSLLANDLSFELSDQYELHNVYTPKYENLTQTRLGGEVNFVKDELFLFALGGNYYLNTSTDSSAIPLLYRPDFDATATLQFCLKDKFFFRLQGVVLGRMAGAYTKDEETSQYSITDTLPLRYGVSCEVEYRHNKALSIFLRGNNLAFQRYYLWSNYPSQRGLIIGGFTYTIPTKRR